MTKFLNQDKIICKKKNITKKNTNLKKIYIYFLQYPITRNYKISILNCKHTTFHKNLINIINIMKDM